MALGEEGGRVLGLEDLGGPRHGRGVREGARRHPGESCFGEGCRAEVTQAF